MAQPRNLHELNKLNLLSLVVPAGTSRATRFSALPDPPNLLRRAAVALAVGVGIAELKPVPLVELAEEAEGATEGRAALPTCTHSLPCQQACLCRQWQKSQSVPGTLNMMSISVKWDSCQPIRPSEGGGGRGGGAFGCSLTPCLCRGWIELEKSQGLVQSDLQNWPRGPERIATLWQQDEQSLRR